MASKKVLMVNLVWPSRRRWSLSLEGTDPGVLNDVAAEVEESAKRHGVAVVNAANPFGVTQVETENGKKNARKARSDKGVRRAEHPAGDGQQIEGRVSSPSIRT